MSDDRKDLPPANSPNFTEKVREALSTYLGNRGNPLDRGVTLRDLVDSGMVILRAGFGSGGKGNPIGGPGSLILDNGGVYEPDLTPPPTPTGFTASAAISNLLLECDPQTYTQGHGHARSKLYGATWTSGSLPVFANAQVITEFQGTVASHATNPATTWHLWLKWVTVDGVESTSPAGGTNGVVTRTGEDVALLLEALNGEIRQSQLYADLGARINLIDGPSSMAGSVAKQVYDEAQARNAAIASEASARAAAILVETNNRNLAIDTINATLSDISGTPDYAAGVTYTVDQIVKYSGGLYKATATTTGNLPTNTSFWAKIGDYASLGDAVAGHSLILNDHETRITNTAGEVTAVASRTTAIETAVNSPTSGLSTKSSVAYVDTAKADAISTAASATQLVQSHLDTTNANVTAAQGTANTAVSNAATAQTTANTAVNAAAAVATRASNLEASVNNGSTGLNSKASVGYVDTAKSDAISAAATASQTLVSSIKVGGRNLLTNSKTMTGSGWSSNVPLISGQADPRGGTSAVKITADQSNSYLLKLVDGAFTTVSTHTLSVWLKGNKAGSVNIQTHDQTVQLSCALTTSWKMFTVTGMVPSLTPSYSFVIGGWATWTDTSLEVYAAFPKLEEGDKATDWTPAPEDVDAAIGASVIESKSYVDTNFYTMANRDISEAANNVTLRAEFAASDATTLSTAQNYTYSKATIDDARTTQTNTITAAYQAADTATLNSSKAYVEGYSYSIANANTAIAGAVQTVSARLNAGGDVNTSIATAKTTADAAVTAAGAVASSVTTLQSSLDRVKNYRIQSIGNAATIGTTGIFAENGTALTGAARSYVLVVLNGSTGDIVSHQGYDVFGMEIGGTAATLAADLNALTRDKVVIVYTHDEPQGNRLTSGLPDAMYRCGASRAVFGSSAFRYRSAYILVGIPGVGEGMGVERYAGAIDNDPNAWVDYQLQLINGRPVALGGNPTAAALQVEATTRATQTGELYAQYTVKLDVGGLVSGYGIASSGINGPGSAFGIRADRFWVAAPAIVSENAPTTNLFLGKSYYKPSWDKTLYLTEYTPGVSQSWMTNNQIEAGGVPPPFSPFVIQATPTTINGVNVPAGVYMDTAFIKNGTMTTAKIANLAVDNGKIADLAVSAAKIADAAITTAKIGTAQITTAKIKDLAVDTLQLAGNAVTIPKYVVIDPGISVFYPNTGIVFNLDISEFGTTPTVVLISIDLHPGFTTADTSSWKSQAVMGVFQSEGQLAYHSLGCNTASRMSGTLLVYVPNPSNGNLVMTLSYGMSAPIPANYASYSFYVYKCRAMFIGIKK